MANSPVPASLHEIGVFQRTRSNAQAVSEIAPGLVGDEQAGNHE
ncbi:MAG: hypothetical protein R2849_22585 [Thermomicrobiales bacterium]